MGSKQVKQSEPVINSRDNQFVRAARAVRDGKQRELIFIEGARLCHEATRAGLVIDAVLLTEQFMNEPRHAGLVRALSDTASHIHILGERVLDFISDTKTPQGVVVLARRPSTQVDVIEKAIEKAPLLVVLHRVGNPSNAGSILRTAEAAGACGAITTVGSIDIFSPKALRGAMGSSFRLPAWTGADYAEALAWCRSRDITIVATDVRAVSLYSDFDWTKPAALVAGAEASGLTIDEAVQADEVVRVPMCSPVESLNVGVATAVVLYEAMRQRRAL